MKILNIYDVNGYKFHTHSWAKEKKTYNVGVNIKGNAFEKDEIDYYDILQDIAELQYPWLNQRNRLLQLLHEAILSIK